MMNFFEVIKTQFQTMAKIPDYEWETFMKIFHIKQFKKGDYFVQTGTFSTDFGFIEKGLMRFFYTTFEGVEFNQTFKKEYDHMLSFTSILLNEPSNFSIQALEDCVVHVGNYRQFEELYNRHNSWQELGRKVAELNFIVKTKKEEQFLLYNAQERYENFITNFPDLARRLPQLHIASYLGVSAETLNRIIRKKK